MAIARKHCGQSGIPRVELRTESGGFYRSKDFRWQVLGPFAGFPIRLVLWYGSSSVADRWECP